jgi:TPP-dependent pyruvate/acetoin dehydrogenase alpha subunit
LPRAAALLPSEAAERIQREVEAEIARALDEARSAPWPDAELEGRALATKEPA